MVSLGQTRSVQASTPASTRPPPLAHDSISRSRCRDAQLVEQPVEGQGLPVHGRSPVVRDVDQVAVVVPLEERDGVLRQECKELVPHVDVGVRVLQVQGLLVAPLRSWGAAPAEHPLGVSAHEVGVLVDHLRLHPEPEVHPERMHPLDQRVQPVGPDVGVDLPVAESGGVGTPRAEPAVVEDEPLDTDLGGHLRELRQPDEVVVEVDRLPGVHQHRAGPLRPGHATTQPAVQARRGLVEAGGRPGADQQGRVVALVLPEHHLARAEELATAEHTLALRRALGVRRVVAGPRHVRGPDLAVAEAEAGHPRGQQQRGVVAGPTVPALAQVGAGRPRTPDRGALAAPPAGHVDQLGRPGRHRQRRADRGQHQRLGRRRWSPRCAGGAAPRRSAAARGPRTSRPRGRARTASRTRRRVRRRPASSSGRPGAPRARAYRRDAAPPARAARCTPRRPARAARAAGARRGPSAGPPAPAPRRDRRGTRGRARRPSAGARGHPRERARARCSRPPASGGQVRLPDGSSYPFTAPEVRPRTKKRCMEKNTIIGINIEMNAPAGSSSLPWP